VIRIPEIHSYVFSAISIHVGRFEGRFVTVSFRSLSMNHLIIYRFLFYGFSPGLLELNNMQLIRGARNDPSPLKELGKLPSSSPG